MPDPQASRRSPESKLDWSEPRREDHREMLELYRVLIACGGSGPNSPIRGSAAITSSSTTTSAGCSSTVPACASRSTCPREERTVPLAAPAGTVLLQTGAGGSVEGDALRLGPHSSMVLAPPSA